MRPGFKDIQNMMKEHGIVSSTTPGEQEWLWSMARVSRGYGGGDVLECGSLNGATAIVMAASLARYAEDRPDRNAPGRVISVDNYSGHEQNPAHNCFEDNVNLVKEFDLDNYLTFVKGDSIEYINSLSKRSLIMAWLDSWHAYKWLMGELNAVMPKMKRSSMICGHDYSFGQNGVVFAVEDFRKQYQENVVGVGAHLRNWWVIVRHPLTGEGVQ